MKTLFTICILFGFIDYLYIHSFEYSGDDFKSNDNFEPKNKISENNAGNDKNLQKFFENKDTICKSNFKKYEDLIKTTDNYVQRFVSLFLIISNLQDYEIKDLNELISVDLELSITGEDLMHLQGYSKSSKNSPYPKNFSKLDAIFSKIARLKERTFAENALKSSKSFLASFYISMISNPIFCQILFLVITLLMTWIIYRHLFYNSLYVFVGLTFNSIMFWESLITYWKKLKEADTEIFVQSLKGVPEECNPKNLRWYHSLLNFFSENQCLQYYQNLNKSAVTEVSLLKCIIDTYGYYLIRTPLRLYGASIRDLTEEISALWPQPIRYFINLPFAPLFGITVAFFILILCQKRLRLSFFGAAVEIGDAQRVVVNKGPLSCKTAKSIKVIRKLRPWTKSRFPKRIESSLGKQKNHFLRASNSESELPSQDEQLIGDSYDKFIINETTSNL